jgi:hypothetical protein
LESRAQIESYLRDLDDAIAAQPLLMTTTIRCWVPGGGAILAHGMTHRKATKDIDAVFDNIDTLLKTPQSDALVKAVRIVARKHHLPKDWLNDDAALFVRDMMPAPELLPWFSGHHLQVDIPSKRCLLVLKLMAGRPKDSDDIDVLLDELDLSTRAQAQDLVNFFVPDRRWHAHEMLPKTLDALFG